MFLAPPATKLKTSAIYHQNNDGQGTAEIVFFLKQSSPCSGNECFDQGGSVRKKSRSALAAGSMLYDK